MIMDDGICTIFRKTDVSAPGGMPTFGYSPIWASWYGELNFETSPAWPTEGRKELRVDKRIRILQYNLLREDDVVVLEHVDSWANISPGATIYRIARVYHGQDDNRPTKISDLTLEVVKP